MKNLIIAYRNLWRNRRRTLITVSSIFFGVFLAVIMSSMQEGSYENMINNVVKFYSGYIQIHEENYWENKTLYNSFEASDELYKSLKAIDEISLITPRLESFALASSEDITQPVMVLGIDPEKEVKLTGISKWIQEGSYLTDSEDGILLASDLAKHLKSKVNDTIALLSQGYYGSTVAEKFIVTGILNFPSPEMNKSFIYMDINKARQFYYDENLSTSLVIMVDNYYEVNPVLKKIRSQLDPPYTAMSWDEMSPEMVQMIQSDRAGGIIMKAILYIIIAFGILGTVMMMIAERRREMGVMVAIGMQKHALAGIVFYETMMIGVIGVISGIMVSIPIIIYFLHNPIPLTGDAARAMSVMGIEPVLVFSAMPSIFINQMITILAITLIISVYPFIKVKRMNVIKAIRG
jgi:ABC-type lipoprotein release transport system permease subunit